MGRAGRPDTLPDEQAARVRDVLRDLLRDKARFPSLTSLGRELGITGSGVSLLVGGEDFGDHTNNSSERTAREAARLANLPVGFWLVDEVSREVPQLVGVALRFEVDEEHGVVLRSNPHAALGDAMKRLPHDTLRRAALAAVFAFGIPIEVASDAALEVYEEEGGEGANNSAEGWLLLIGRAVHKRKKVSGSYPRIRLIGEFQPDIEPDPPSPSISKSSPQVRKSG